MKDNITADQNPLDTVEGIYEITMLLDFYGQLLTERQYQIMDLHYNSDLSLGEIADELGISRQGVHDSIRKARQTLFQYENRLRLAERFKEQEKSIEKALRSLIQIKIKMPEIIKDSDFKTAVDILEKLLDTL